MARFRQSLTGRPAYDSASWGMIILRKNGAGALLRNLINLLFLGLVLRIFYIFIYALIRLETFVLMMASVALLVIINSLAYLYRMISLNKQ